jgi:hypothetical protein
MARTIVIESFEEFAERHGGKRAQVLVDGKRYFADGASCDEEFRQRWEPSTDPQSNAEQRKRYLTLKLKDEERLFNNFKRECLQQAKHAAAYPGSCPPPSEQAIASLQAGKERIERLREQLDEVDNELAEYPDTEEAIQRERGELLGDYSQQARDIGEAIEAIEI